MASEAKKKADYQARVDADTAYLATFGLETQMNALGYCTKLDADDVVKLLKSFDAKSVRSIRSKVRRAARV